MKPKVWNLVGRLASRAGLVLCLAISITPPMGADEPKSGPGKLEGTWFTQVTIRDCQTGAVLRTFPALNTFAREETLIDTTTGFSPALRSPGQGTWEKTGRQTYSATSLAFLFNPAGAWAGTQKLTHTIEVKGDENQFKSAVEIFDTAGNVTTTGCATAVGRRL